MDELADHIEADTLTAAQKRNPGVNPRSILLSDRERIAYRCIDDAFYRQESRFRLIEAELARLRRVAVSKDDGA